MAKNKDLFLCSSEELLRISKRLYSRIAKDFEYRKKNSGYENLTVGEAVINCRILSIPASFGAKLQGAPLLRHPITSSGVAKFFDWCIEECSKTSNWDSLRCSTAISEAVDFLSHIGASATSRYGLTIRIDDLIGSIVRRDELGTLLTEEVNSAGKEYSQIEEDGKTRLDRLMTIIRKDKSLSLHQFAASETGINESQLAQVLLSVGMKPDLKGVVIPFPIDSSFFAGLKTKQEFFVNAIGGRKALVNNATMVRTAGYLMRKLSLLELDVIVDPGVEDCGTTHYITVDVTDENILKRLRWRRMADGTPIDVSDKSLIGKCVPIRSPITCALPGTCCKRCYGDLYEVNKDRHQGLIASHIVSNPLMQLMLSAKHNLRTKSTKIIWDGFKDYFSIDQGDIFPETKISMIRVYVRSIDQMEEGSPNISLVPGAAIKVKIKEDMIKVRVPKNACIILANWVKDYMENLVSVDPDCKFFDIPTELDPRPFFHIIMNNEELNKSLLEIKKFLDAGEHGIEEKPLTIDKITNTFFAKIAPYLKIHLVHAECILRELFRGSGPDGRPDFSRADSPWFEFVGIQNSLLNSPSLSKSFGFERVKTQIEDPFTYKKARSSCFDGFID